MKKSYCSNWIALVLAWNLLTACSGGIPVGAMEILPISQQATVSGVYSVAIGAQPLGRVLENAQQLRVVVWPGAKMATSAGVEQLWNYACVLRCEGDWLNQIPRYVAGPGRTVNGATMSKFVADLKAMGFRELAPSALAAGESLSAFASQLSGAVFGFMVLPVGTIPEELLTEVRG